MIIVLYMSKVLDQRLQELKMHNVYYEKILWCNRKPIVASAWRNMIYLYIKCKVSDNPI